MIRAHVVRALVAALAALVVLVFPRFVWADELRASVDANVIEVGQTVSLRLEGTTTSGDVGTVEPGPTPGFRVIGRSVMPTRMVSIVNGVRTDRSGVQATFTLLAERTGTFSLGPCSASFGGRIVRSGRAEVRVVARGQAPRRPEPQDPFAGLFGRRTAPSPHSNPFDFLDEPQAPPEPTVDPKLALPAPRGTTAFLHATVDKHAAVVGEQVTFSVYLYVEGSSREPQIGDVHEASAPAFLRKSLLENDNEAKHLGLAKVGDQIYEVKLVRRVALFPLKAGALPIAGMTLRIFRNASQRQRPESIRESETLEVVVSEPPAAGKIPGTSLGDVGDFTLRAEVAPREIPRGGAVAVNLTVEGYGNFPNRLALPTVKGAEWLEPEVQEKLGAGPDDRYGGSRTFRYVVRLREPGAFSLGSVAFPYYSARHKKYETARADLGFVTVTNDGKAPPPADEKEQMLPGLPPPRGGLEGTTMETTKPISDKGGAWLLVFASPLAFVALSLGARAKDRFVATRRDRETSPDAELARRIAVADAAVKKSEPLAAVRAALTVLEQGALVKLGIAIRGASEGEKRTKLTEAGLEDADVTAWLEAFASAEARRYAPEPPTADEAREEVARAKALVNKAKKRKPSREDDA